LLLIAAPMLTFFSPESGFPFGGAWGIIAIDYLQGLLGRAGTGMVLLSLCLFLLFVIYALDLRPWWKKWKGITRPLFASSMSSSAVAPMGKDPSRSQRDETAAHDPLEEKK